jgi:hypothetical protein
VKTRSILLAALLTLLLGGGNVAARPLDSGVILDLLGAGVSESSVRHYVERNHFTLDLTADDLKALKQAGASDDLISFLQDREELQVSGEGSGRRDSQVTGSSGDEGEYDGEEASPEDGGDYDVGYYSPGYSYGYYGYAPVYYSPFYYDPYYYPSSYFGFSYYHPYYYGRPGTRYYVRPHSGRTRGVYSQLFPGRTGVRSPHAISSPMRSHPGGVASRTRGRGRH